MFVYMLRWRQLFLCRQRDRRRPDVTLAQHQAGTFEGYTSLRRPVQLVWSEHFDRITDAIAIERKIKGWSRAKKQALINGDWDSVQRVSKRRGGKPRP